MTVSDRKRAVGVFSSRQQAEQALNELKASGFPMDNVSIIAKNADHNEQLSGAEMSDRIGEQKVGTATQVLADTVAGTTWGTLLVGLSSLALPGVGVVLAAGSLGVALVTGVASTAIGAAAAGGLVRALTDLGIPEQQASAYSDRLHQADYLAILDGTDDEIRRAEAIFSDQGIQAWGVYNSPQA